MLDTDTRRRIDTARDILVGKVPDPKSQVEQITIALIYKFMDDMDLESEELGGTRNFFAGEFARYGWAKLMRSGLGGHETLNLYAEAIAKMPENPGIPPLFRDIFKNAYLPYRDPETLRAFLKIIDEFEYDHSERLGDAFEYLLSVLGSQGDAGQFRTPRHIIDFIVEIVDPKKTETVLDPACGTAGFLISSYKHILRANTDQNGHSTLTPDERGRLAANFKGYDISPDMVRLSLVNLYLHGFSDPHIHEYDTLTSQERWNEYADVILANPPFMSPKGGIKPHNRFSVQSKRSEVLFVDYMAEHLTPSGRAGIIVPEGIIFQSQTAYTQLRKLLVEQYLVAVVSLPAGVFNPYSGVKTSILILDKALAKRTDRIAFFKVENDGFGLGAQRRPIDKNDLPQVLADVSEYLRRLRSKESVLPLPPGEGRGEGFTPTRGLIIAKEKIAANGDYNLSGERYRDNGARTSSFPFASIGEIAEVASGFGFPVDEQGKLDQPIPFLKVSDMNLPHNQRQIVEWNNTVSREVLTRLGAKSFPAGTVIFPKIGAAIATNKKRVLTRESTFDNNVMGIVPSDRLLSDFLFAIIQTIDLSIWASESQPPSMRKSVVEAYEIPLPPLEVQKEIVAEIEGYQKVIDGARAVLDNYRPHIPIHPDWPMVAIQDVASVESGFGFPVDRQGLTDEEIPFLKVSDMNLPGNEIRILTWNNAVSRDTLRELRARSHPSGTVIFPKIGAAIATNKKRLLTRESTFDNNVMGIVPDPAKLVPEYLHTWLLGFDLSLWASQAQPPSMRKTVVEAHEIPCPNIETQRAIVAEIEAEQALVNANRELIARMEKKIQATLARVWGEEATAPRGV